MATPAPRKVKTRYPGIYKRGGRFLFVYRDRLGRQKWGTADTAEAARRLKGDRERDARAGLDLVSSQNTLAYLREWVGRYHGTGRRGFREETRVEYRRIIETVYTDALSPYEKLSDLTPKRVSELVAWCARQKSRRGGTWSDQTIRNVLSPLRAAMGTALLEGLVQRDPTDGMVLPHRPRVEDEHTDARPLSLEQLATFLALVPARHRLLARFAAETGLRVSELAGLDVRHLVLNGSHPHVLVRQRWRHGNMEPPKSKYAKRDVPINPNTVGALRDLVRGRAAKAPTFTSPQGHRLDADNARKRWLSVALEEADVGWASWHTLRHTCASVLFAQGRNVVEVQEWLGHHSPSFTLDTYVHLLEADKVGAPLDFWAPPAPITVASGR